eukprot:5934275-Pyramimonas_sp.AAC.1
MGDLLRASLSTDCPAVQSTTQEPDKVGSLCTDAHICQEPLGFNQASDRVHIYTLASIRRLQQDGAKLWRSANDLFWRTASMA